MSNYPDGCTPADIDREMDDAEHVHVDEPDCVCLNCGAPQSDFEQLEERCISCVKSWD